MFYRWSELEAAQKITYKLLKMLVGPGVVPPASKLDNLQCQTTLTALMGAKGIFLNCNTASRDNLPDPTRNVLAAFRHDAKAQGGIR